MHAYFSMELMISQTPSPILPPPLMSLFARLAQDENLNTTSVLSFLPSSLPVKGLALSEATQKVVRGRKSLLLLMQPICLWILQLLCVGLAQATH